MTTHTSHPAEARFTYLLAATAVGVYLLVAVGTTTALLDGAAACPTWPACHGAWLVPLDDPALAVAWGHRVATVTVGALLLVTVWLGRGVAAGRVRGAVLVSTGLYPLQIGLGAVTATSGASLALSAAHLVVALGIFSGLLVALLWHLEDRAAEDTPFVSAAHRAAGRSERSRAPVAASPRYRVVARARAYLALTKPRLMWLLCLVALAAMALGAGRALDPGTVVATLAGGMLAIGASGTFNNVLERDVDRRMRRTAGRPLVNGELPVGRAVAFGVLLTVASAAVFVLFVNALAAALGLLAVLFYSVVYTLYLKPHTDQNIVIGGAVGAFPALIGWAAVTDSVGLPALVLGAVIFLWTPAHFYNLALAYRQDYARAGFPMLPVVRGEATTLRHILLYLGATMLAAVALGAVTRTDWPYALTVSLVGGVFLWAVVRLFRERSNRAALRAFHASNAYLGTLLLAVAADALLV